MIKPAEISNLAAKGTRFEKRPTTASNIGIVPKNT